MMVEIHVPTVTNLDDLHLDVCMEALTDIKTAIENSLRTIFPMIPIEVKLVVDPYPSLRFDIPELANDPRYPSFIKIWKSDMAAVRLSDYGRRKLGLPDRS
jgi:hypothetical protein